MRTRDDLRTRSLIAWCLSAAATAVWVVAVGAAGMFGRVAEHWEAAVTMLFGSFLAGSSPEGGGAVAFPVFTKLLHVPAPIARTFGLSIQAVGMTMAVIAIILFRRAIHVRAVVVGSIAAIVGLAISLVVLGDSELPFWPATIGTAWVKATFSIILATTSVLMVRHLRGHDERGGESTLHEFAWTRRIEVTFAVVAFAGGALSSLTGTGANILVFLFLLVIVEVNPKIALPTALAVMAAVSVVGFVILGIIDGQLNVTVVGDQVVSVGGQAFVGASSETDLLGLWLAAVPIVVWGAPIGSWAADRVPEAWIVKFVAVLATLEVVTTVVLVDDLRSDPAMIAFLAIGLVVLPTAFILASVRRRQLFAAR